MKAFLRKTNPEKCRCGADRDATVKGSVYDDGRVKKVLKEIAPCAECGDPQQVQELTAGDIGKVEENHSTTKMFTAKEMYYVKEKKSVGDELFSWCLIKWKGKWELEDLKAFTGRIMSSLNIPADEDDGTAADYGAVFSRETKQFFVREDKIDLFEGILADYTGRMQPFDRVSDEKVKALEEAFNVKKPA